MSIDLTTIKALAFDVDGVLTDGALWWGADGEEFKRFSFTDIMGISLARRAGYQLTLISGENSPLVTRYAEKMHITDVTKGCRDKATALREYAERNQLQLSEICFMGDDVNDLPAMALAGMSAAPANAAKDVLAKVDFTCTHPGGQGAVRELIDTFLAAKGLIAEDVFKIKL